MKNNSFKFWIIASFFMLLIVFIFCEGLSFFYLRFRLGTLAPLFEQNSRIGYSCVPNFSINYDFNEDNQPAHEIAINSKGLRDKERTYKKDKNRYRILLLGDSMVFAHQVAQQYRFTELLEDKLNTENQQRNYEVINGGIDGYGTTNELLFYMNEGFQYEADLVILTFYIANDIMDNSLSLLRKEKPYFVSRPYFTVQNNLLSLNNYPSESSFITRLSLYQLLSNTTGKYFPGFVKWMNQYDFLEDFPLYGAYIENGIPLHIRVYFEEYDQEWIDAWEVTRALITKFRDETARHETDFLVFIMPDKLQLGHGPYWEWTDANFPGIKELALDMNKPNKILHEWLTEKQIPFLDLLPMFVDYEAKTGEPLYFKVDMHLNQHGHQFVSGALWDFLFKNGYLLE